MAVGIRQLTGSAVPPAWHAAALLLAAVLTQAPLPHFHIQRHQVFGKECWVARTGYTGEDGFEIFCEASDALAYGTRSRRYLRQPGTEHGGSPLAPVATGVRRGEKGARGAPRLGLRIAEGFNFGKACRLLN